MKKFSKAFGIVGLALAASVSAGFAADGGSSTAAFLRIGQGARAEGMGGAFTAVADDAYAAYWNPAGLAQITRIQVGLNHLQFVEKINSQYASAVLPVNKLNGSIGVSATYMDLGSIERRDASNASVGGDTNVNSYAGAVSWGQALGERVAIGASGKILNQNLAGDKASGMAGDLGLLFQVIPDRLMFGFAATNLGPKLKTGTTDESLPRTLRGGMALELAQRQLVLALDGEKERDQDAMIHVGGEYTYQSRFIVRAGYQNLRDAKGGLSAGAGFIWRPRRDGASDFFGNQDTKNGKNEGVDVRFDYGFVDYGDFSSTHRIGVLIAF